MGGDFGVASRSEGGVEEGDSLKKRDFSIISRRESISVSCLAWIEATAVATADATALVIDCWREESMILDLAVISSKRETASGNLSAFVSQEGSYEGEGSLAVLVRRLGGTGSRRKGGTRVSTRACRPGSIRERLVRPVSR